MITSPLISSLVRATSSISSSTNAATPLQRTIIQSRRYQQCTSVRFILIILSAIYLMGCISYCCYIIIATYHFYPYPFTQHPLPSSSSATSAATNYFRDAKNRRVHVFYWDNDEFDDENQAGLIKHSKIGASSTQLSTTSFASKVYYPWNMFATNVKDHSYIRNNEDTSRDMTKQQMPQHEKESSKNVKDDYDDDSGTGSGNNNDDNDDDDTMQQPSLAQHIVQHAKKYSEQSSTTASTSNSNSKNPAIYGWTPNQYPNPIVDPVHCAVSYILPHLQQQQQEQQQQPSPPIINDEVKAMTTPLSSPNYISKNSTLNKNDDIVLRLCDPDWVLGGIYLEDVAMALYNFSTLFGSQNHEENHADERNDNKDNMAESKEPNTSSSDTIDSQMTTNNEDPQSPHEEDWNVEIGPSNRRRSLRSDVYLSSTSTLLHESNNVVHRRRTQSSTTANEVPRIELAVATVRKMNIPLVLRQGNANNNNYNGNNYYATYENDDDDLVNDAAQIFARTLHDNWWSSIYTTNGTGEREGEWYGNGKKDGDASDEENPADYGILLFLSVQDRVCFISTGSSISVTILPWWRLDHIVTNMKPYLQNRNYGIAILHAIHDISNMLLTGPPTLSDRIHDFVSRFGIVIAFAAFTFCFGAVRIAVVDATISFQTLHLPLSFNQLLTMRFIYNFRALLA
jgi:TPM domain